jgi:hypothetical protein
MMVDNQLATWKPLDESCHIPKLCAAREIEDHDRLAIRQILRHRPWTTKLSKPRAIPIKKVVPRRRGARIHNSHVLAGALQQASHPNFRAECIAIRPDMRRHKESFV